MLFLLLFVVAMIFMVWAAIRSSEAPTLSGRTSSSALAGVFCFWGLEAAGAWSGVFSSPFGDGYMAFSALMSLMLPLLLWPWFEMKEAKAKAKEAAKNAVPAVRYGEPEGVA